MQPTLYDWIFIPVIIKLKSKSKIKNLLNNAKTPSTNYKILKSFNMNTLNKNVMLFVTEWKKRQIFNMKVPRIICSKM